MSESAPWRPPLTHVPEGFDPDIYGTWTTAAAALVLDCSVTNVAKLCRNRRLLSIRRKEVGPDGRGRWTWFIDANDCLRLKSEMDARADRLGRADG